MSCKIKFGISFHSNMSIEDIVQLWCRRASAEVKAQFPQIDDYMEQAKAILIILRQARGALKLELETLKVLQKSGELAAASVTQTAGPLIAQYASVEVKKIAMQLAGDSINSLGVTVSAAFQCPPEEPDTAKLDQYLSKTDRELASLLLTLETNICNSLGDLTP